MFWGCKIVLLIFGFIFFFGIGGVVIYFIIREFYNREWYYYSGVVSENRIGFVLGDISINEFLIGV